MSRDLPIIFSGTMVRALLEGRKTMTRRLAWRDLLGQGDPDDPEACPQAPTPWQRVEPGDRLWVKETWGTGPGPGIITHETSRPNVKGKDGFWHPVYFRAGTENHAWGMYGEPTWKSPLHCARSSSRLTLVVTATKMERLNDISHDDAVGEGVAGDSGPGLTGAFIALWEKLHGDGSWADNPEVVALTFKVHQKNIDSLPKARAA